MDPAFNTCVYCHSFPFRANAFLTSTGETAGSQKKPSDKFADKERSGDEFMLGALLCVGLISAISVTEMRQTPPNLVEVSGTVIDVNGEAIPKAKVILRQNDGLRKDGAKDQTTISNAMGAFRFARVASGTYEVVVQKEAFKPAVIQLSVGARAPASLHVTLEVPDLREEITVSNESGQVNTNPAENLDVIKLDLDALNNLPVRPIIMI